MNLRHVWIVFSTDLMNTLRDRRTWLAMVVIPLLLVPLMLVVMPSALEGEQRRLAEARLDVAVVGADHAPELLAYLSGTGEVALMELAEPEEALRGGVVAAVLHIEPEFDARVARGEAGALRLVYDGSRPASEVGRARLERLVSAYAQARVAVRLAQRGIDPALLVPVQTEVHDAAPAERAGAYFLASLLPMLLAVWAALGGMYAAIDGVAGEKERGTLEPLLATAPSRASFVAGKYLTVVLTSVVAAAIALVGMYLAYLIKPEAITGGAGGLRLFLTWDNALVALGTALLLAAFFAAVELALSAFARSFREAQSYLSPLTIVIVIPGLLTQFSDPHAVASWMYAIPVVSALLVFKEALLGAVDFGHVALMAASSLAAAALALRFTLWLFHRESVLFRT